MEHFRRRGLISSRKEGREGASHSHAVRTKMRTRLRQDIDTDTICMVGRPSWIFVRTGNPLRAPDRSNTHSLHFHSSFSLTSNTYVRSGSVLSSLPALSRSRNRTLEFLLESSSLAFFFIIYDKLSVRNSDHGMEIRGLTSKRGFGLTGGQ